MSSPERDTRDPGSAFRRAWIESDDDVTASPELLPVRLTTACVAVLPIDGAGLSLHDMAFRVPMGASDDIATVAERLQFTQGEGPCLDAAASRRFVVAGDVELTDRWPSFTDELFQQTPYRAIASLPLAITPRFFGALDLYFIDPADVERMSLIAAAAVCDEIVDALTQAADLALPYAPDAQLEDDSVETDLFPVWLRIAPARERTFVWVAMGMAMTEFHVDAADALALLRSFAYGHGLLIDDVATQLVDGTLTLADIQP